MIFESKRKLKERAENAERRATIHLRKLQEIERTITIEESNKTPAVFILDKIKEVINPTKSK